MGTGRRFGGLLLVTGAAVGIAAVVALVLGFEPSRLPPALLDIAAYKLTFAAAAALLATGAIIRRHGNRKDDGPTGVDAMPSSFDAPAHRSSAAVNAAGEEAELTRAREPDNVRRPDR